MRDKNIKLLSLVFISFIMIFFYLYYNLNYKYFDYIFNLRISKIIVIIIVSICIGTASIIFQTVVNNDIVTPCLLGMNTLYTLIHTIIIFVFSSSNIIVKNDILSYIVDLSIMVFISTLLYGYIFKKTNYNVLLILLLGTILSIFFSSIQNTLIMIMDPNEYNILLNNLVANFTKVNDKLILISIFLIIILIFYLKKYLLKLDVISLGRSYAINLGVDYDKTLNILLIFVSILIAIATAIVGPISFLGLIIANLSKKFLITYNHFYLILGSILIGIIILVLSQLGVEYIFKYSVTINVFINLIGGIYFLYLLIIGMNVRK